MVNVISKAGGLASLALIVFLAVTPTFAQNTGMRMDIPVSFLAGDQTLPAGSYVVRIDERFRLMQIEGWNVSTTVRLAAKSTPRPNAHVERGAILFEKYGDVYVLRNAFRHDESLGWAVPQSQREVELAKVHPVRETALVAARNR